MKSALEKTRIPLPDSEGKLGGSLVLDDLHLTNVKLLSSDGASGLTYRATAEQWLGKHAGNVIIKECYPVACAHGIRRDELTLVCDGDKKATQVFYRYLEKLSKAFQIHADAFRLLEGQRITRPGLLVKANGTAYAVTDADGGDTFDIAVGYMPVADQIRALLNICSTIGKLHESHLVYLDLKPSNVLVSSSLNRDKKGKYSTEIRLFDFDSCLPFDKAKNETLISGSDGWSSWEQTHNGYSSEVGIQSDVYSIGSMLFWLTFGRPPSSTEVVNADGHWRLNPKMKPNPTLTGSAQAVSTLLSILNKTLVIEADRRFADMTACADAIKRLLESIEPMSPTAISEFSKQGDLLFVQLTSAISSMLESKNTDLLKSIANVLPPNAKSNDEQEAPEDKAPCPLMPAELYRDADADPDDWSNPEHAYADLSSLTPAQRDVLAAAALVGRYGASIESIEYVCKLPDQMDIQRLIGYGMLEDSPSTGLIRLSRWVNPKQAFQLRECKNPLRRLSRCHKETINNQDKRLIAILNYASTLCIDCGEKSEPAVTSNIFSEIFLAKLDESPASERPDDEIATTAVAKILRDLDFLEDRDEKESFISFCAMASEAIGGETEQQLWKRALDAGKGMDCPSAAIVANLDKVPSSLEEELIEWLELIISEYENDVEGTKTFDYGALFLAYERLANLLHNSDLQKRADNFCREHSHELKEQNRDLAPLQALFDDEDPGPLIEITKKSLKDNLAGIEGSLGIEECMSNIELLYLCFYSFDDTLNEPTPADKLISWTMRLPGLPLNFVQAMLNMTWSLYKRFHYNLQSYDLSIFEDIWHKSEELDTHSRWRASMLLNIHNHTTDESTTLELARDVIHDASIEPWRKIETIFMYCWSKESHDYLSRERVIELLYDASPAGMPISEEVKNVLDEYVLCYLPIIFYYDTPIEPSGFTKWLMDHSEYDADSVFICFFTIKTINRLGTEQHYEQALQLCENVLKKATFSAIKSRSTDPINGLRIILLNKLGKKDDAIAATIALLSEDRKDNDSQYTWELFKSISETIPSLSKYLAKQKASETTLDVLMTFRQFLRQTADSDNDNDSALRATNKAIAKVSKKLVTASKKA